MIRGGKLPNHVMKMEKMKKNIDVKNIDFFSFVKETVKKMFRYLFVCSKREDSNQLYCHTSTVYCTQCLHSQFISHIT